MDMDNLLSPTAAVTPHEIAGLSVYGMQQVSYEVKGKEGLDFATALSLTALQKTDAMDQATQAYSEMVRLRMRKLDEVGEALSILTKAIASMPQKGGKDTLSSSDAELKRANDLLKKYDITPLDLVIEKDKAGNETSWKVTREEALMRKNEIQYILDSEDNTLQQDMLALRSLVSKRDNSFSTASRLLTKISNTAQSSIRNFGA